MRRSMVLGILVCVGALVVTPVIAGPAEDAAKAFAEGEALLAKADFDEALKAFRTAAQADRENQDYRQQYGVLRQIVRLRGEIQEEHSGKWLGMARALRTYYHAHGIYGEALPIDRKIYEQHPGADEAVKLAETQLALGMTSEAVATLRSVEEREATGRTNVLLGLALARQGKIEQAKALAEDVVLNEDEADRRAFYELAGLRALIGDTAGAFEALTRSFELTPASQLEEVKAEARACPDFATLTRTIQFSKVLQTESEVKESSCSQGTGCGSCPKRASCGGCAGKKSESGDAPCPHAKNKP
jgi:tetratricopeptide (TPR) repeat protein